MMANDRQVIDSVEWKAKSIIRFTTTIHKTIKWNASYSLYSEYSDYFEIANYQLAALETAMLLGKHDRYKEAFVVLRAELERMMLFSLMTRGKRYFLLFKKFKKESDATAIARLNSDIATVKAQGKKTFALKAENYPWDGVVKVVYEGPYLNGQKGKGNLVPYYFNLFRDYNPKDAFLDASQYFQYMHTRFNRQINQKRKQESRYRYAHYMSYGALLHSLIINRLITNKQSHRLAAHYNFLSEFVHPAGAAIDRLKVRNRQNSYISSLRDVREESASLRLMIADYAGYIAASIAEDILYVLDNAPKRNIVQYDRSNLRKSLDDFYVLADHFWFIKNDPHTYDKFYHCIHYELKNAVKLANDYKSVSINRVRFQSNILERFMSLQRGWSNTTWKKYRPPFTLHN